MPKLPDGSILDPTLLRIRHLVPAQKEPHMLGKGPTAISTQRRPNQLHRPGWILVLIFRFH